MLSMSGNHENWPLVGQERIGEAESQHIAPQNLPNHPGWILGQNIDVATKIKKSSENNEFL